MVDNSVMEAVEEEVADIPVDVALADEPEGYTVLPTCQILRMEVVDEEVAQIPVDVALADEPEEYMVMIDNFVMDLEVADIQADVALADEPEGYMVMIDNFEMHLEAVDLEVSDIPVDVALTDEAEEYMVMVDNFAMEALDEEVADIPVDVPLADEAEGYMVMIDNFVMDSGAVDSEVADIPADVALDEPEGYMVMIDNFVMEAVDEDSEVADIPVDADEAEEYIVMVDNFAMEALDEVADIPVDVVAGEPEGYPAITSKTATLRTSEIDMLVAGAAELDGLSDTMNRDKNGDGNRRYPNREGSTQVGVSGEVRRAKHPRERGTHSHPSGGWVPGPPSGQSFPPLTVSSLRKKRAERPDAREKCSDLLVPLIDQKPPKQSKALRTIELLVAINPRKYRVYKHPSKRQKKEKMGSNEQQLAPGHRTETGSHCTGLVIPASPSSFRLSSIIVEDYINITHLPVYRCRLAKASSLVNIMANFWARRIL
ncbi:hypothetical protein IW262DRAFT_1298122 [Armillaria fumosa]|nr:hypothetical protein IW262DRAFT_1298122 [Armillaria fumosa]